MRAFLPLPHGLGTALAFLSRIAPATQTTTSTNEADTARILAASIPWFPVAGAILGLVATLLPWAGVFFIPAFPPILGAWLYLLALALLTRCLHWDGLADLCDACGSSATGELFWNIMKDSRVGAFGVLGLLFGFSGMGIAAWLCCSKGLWGALVAAPAFGRAMVVPLGRLTQPVPRSRLASLFLPGTRTPNALIASLAAIAVCGYGIGPFALATALALTGCCLYFLHRTAARQGGSNGDFCGVIILAGEFSLLLAAGITA